MDFPQGIGIEFSGAIATIVTIFTVATIGVIALIFLLLGIAHVMEWRRTRKSAAR